MLEATSPPILLVLDMQEDFFQQGRLHLLRSYLTAAINLLVNTFHGQKYPVIWVCQEIAADHSNAPLSMRRSGNYLTVAGTQGRALLPELRRHPEDIEVIKTRYSAFFQTDLDAHLQRLQPSLLVVCGINTHACVRTTLIDAYQRDIEAILASEATASYNAPFDRDTRTYLASQIKSVDAILSRIT